MEKTTEPQTHPVQLTRSEVDGVVTTATAAISTLLGGVSQALLRLPTFYSDEETPATFAARVESHRADVKARLANVAAAVDRLFALHDQRSRLDIGVEIEPPTEAGRFARPQQGAA